MARKIYSVTPGEKGSFRVSLMGVRSNFVLYFLYKNERTPHSACSFPGLRFYYQVCSCIYKRLVILVHYYYNTKNEAKHSGDTTADKCFQSFAVTFVSSFVLCGHSANFFELFSFKIVLFNWDLVCFGHKSWSIIWCIWNSLTSTRFVLWHTIINQQWSCFCLFLQCILEIHITKGTLSPKVHGSADTTSTS